MGNAQQVGRERGCERNAQRRLSWQGAFFSTLLIGPARDVHGGRHDAIEIRDAARTGGITCTWAGYIAPRAFGALHWAATAYTT
jgi:hypothetical protein